MKRKIISAFVACWMLILLFVPTISAFATSGGLDLQNEPTTGRIPLDFERPEEPEEPEEPIEDIKLVDLNTTWKYLDDNTDPAKGLSSLDAWTAINFDDSKWKTGKGPLGNEKDAKTSPIYATPNPNTLLTLYRTDKPTYSVYTYFFRTDFTINSLESIKDYNALAFEVYANDAVVIYVNGVKVCDSREVVNETKNLYYTTGKWQQREFKVMLSDIPGGLKEGKNVVSVQLHNKAFDSKDVYFAMPKLDLVAYNPTPYSAKQTVLSVGSDESERNLAWLSNIAEAGEVRLAEASNVKDGVFPDEYTSFAATSLPSINIYDTYAKKATLKNLKSDTAYAYVIAAGGKTSDIYYFSTASSGSYDFVFLTDPQIKTEEHGKSWADTVNKAVSSLGADFIVSAGDQIESADSELLYSYAIVDALSGVAFAPSVGPGHDSQSSHYSDHFNLPNLSADYGKNKTSADYWYTYNGTLFMHLNMSDDGASNNGEHEAFMKEAIAANPDTKWKIVVMHYSVYSTGKHGGTNAKMIEIREKLVPIFTELDVDIVLSGHDHVYTRTHIMNGLTVSNDTVVNNTVVSPNGVLYLCANSCTGSKFYSQVVTDADFVAKDDYSYRKSAVKLEVTDTSIKLTSYFLDGNEPEEFDTFTIEKPAQVHTCTSEPVAEKPATCNAPGKEAYYLCDCGKAYEDEDCENLISDIAVWGVIPQKPHDYTGEWQKDKDGHWHVCKNDGCTVTDTKAPHVSSGTATETEPEKCTVCDYVITPALSHTHNHTIPNFDTMNHWNECACGQSKENVTPHTTTDDGDCTTAIVCSCGYTVLEAKTAHTPMADDGDCTTAVKCQYCDEITTTAKTAHIPMADDGDCTTAVKCQYCNEITTTAKSTHTGGTATCNTKAVCAICGKSYGDFAQHTPSADDGNCTTEVICSVCDAVTTPAKTAHTDSDSDGKCDVCAFVITQNAPENSGTTDTPPTTGGEENDGLSGGAVAAIAIGATVVVGGAGFSVYWFIIRKKKTSRF